MLNSMFFFPTTNHIFKFSLWLFNNFACFCFESSEFNKRINSQMSQNIIICLHLMLSTEQQKTCKWDSNGKLRVCEYIYINRVAVSHILRECCEFFWSATWMKKRLEKALLFSRRDFHFSNQLQAKIGVWQHEKYAHRTWFASSTRANMECMRWRLHKDDSKKDTLHTYIHVHTYYWKCLFFCWQWNVRDKMLY